jgi:hypothetical protein
MYSEIFFLLCFIYNTVSKPLSVGIILWDYTGDFNFYLKLRVIVFYYCFFMSMSWGSVSELRPTAGLLFISQMIYEYGQPRWNDTDRGRPKNAEKTYPSTTLYTTNLIWN